MAVVKGELDKKLDCGLYLGELEMSISDLLDLRPGARIEFERPKNFQAIFQAAGGDWAKAEVTLTENGVCLEIKELLP